MRIQVHPDHLREVAWTFNRQSTAMQEIEEDLCRAIGGLDTWAWDGRSRARAEPLLGRVGPEGRHLAGQLEELGRQLQRVAEEFERTDLFAAQGLPQAQIDQGFSHQSDFSSKGPVSVPRPDLPYEAIIASIWGGFTLSTLSLAFKGFKTITTVQAVLNASTISGYTGVPDLVLKGVLRAPKHWPFWLGVGAKILSEIGENWSEFGGDVLRVLLATVVESALGIGLTTFGMGLGILLSGAIGSVFGPAGAVIGGKIGAIIGGWLGSKAAEWVENIPVGGQSVARSVEEGIMSAPGYVVDQVLLPFVNGVASPVF